MPIIPRTGMWLKAKLKVRKRTVILLQSSIQQSQENSYQYFACNSTLCVCTWEWVVCVARKPGTEEAEQSGRNSQSESIGGASEQSQNGTRPKRYRHQTSLQLQQNLDYAFGGLIKYEIFLLGLLLLQNTWKCTTLKRRSETLKVYLTTKLNQITSLLYRNSKLISPPSCTRNSLPPTGPPRVCVLPWHLCVPATPGCPLLGQTLPAAPWGPGADCQESGCLERRGGQTRLQSHAVPTQEKQTYWHTDQSKKMFNQNSLLFFP